MTDTMEPRAALVFRHSDVPVPESELMRIDISRVAIYYQLAGRRWPMRTAPRCKVCQHPERLAIEEGIILNFSTGYIIERLNDPGDLSDQGIRRHLRNHMPGQLAVRRAILAGEADDMMVMDYKAMLELIAHGGIERLLSGEIRPSLGESLTALRVLYASERGEDVQEQIDVLREGHRIWAETVRKIMSRDQWQQLAGELRGNVELQALRSEKPAIGAGR